MTRVGIFLDRDGTVNEEVDFLSSANELHLIPGAPDAIREANKLGLKVIIITNQSGIARGILSEDQLLEIHRNLLQRLDELDAHVDAIYYCPHHPELGNGPYQIECECRKPNIGMLTQAAKELDLDLKKSFLVGDRMIDIQAGNNAGTVSILVLTGYGKQELELCQQNNAHIEYIAENLNDALQYIKHTLHQEQPSVS